MAHMSKPRGYLQDRYRPTQSSFPARESEKNGKRPELLFSNPDSSNPGQDTNLCLLIRFFLVPRRAVPCLQCIITSITYRTGQEELRRARGRHGNNIIMHIITEQHPRRRKEKKKAKGAGATPRHTHTLSATTPELSRLV